MKLDLDNIERVAKWAQEHRPGPWKRYRYGAGVVLPSDANTRIDCIVDSSPRPDWHDAACISPEEWHGETILETDGGYYEPKGVIAEHIANCSPDVVLALVARIRELEAGLRNAEHALHPPWGCT